jgi:hypothetical protein
MTVIKFLTDTFLLLQPLIIFLLTLVLLRFFIIFFIYQFKLLFTVINVSMAIKLCMWLFNGAKKLAFNYLIKIFHSIKLNYGLLQIQHILQKNRTKCVIVEETVF